uniref:Uncharacterized protein n=1 Tax=Chromera velia CCMP2878 TaxID=1169474 RepID=A0A0G4F480_9ALVE|mmetsp:Transcript_42615/g.84042  ORF Transcript_42615/g.84042 Transcript_42615/m.84042 type:complete len:158 (-) Transcript_42615:117-590(-)|eukprot:Cvel_15120.t1-p1 / transcript=Cvel_15120.t1 / gene=Cvel_15120 / organism=Chromera_velia_CCMP2878 / gene_product=hypothetical protein / transcript_product=hypothetical protein / location=Cvel_scaffold1103:42777-43247(+) / protein_length=157 / sequence_SO=supercontig / SO=protein_coding / is_pseudo=false
MAPRQKPRKTYNLREAGGKALESSRLTDALDHLNSDDCKRRARPTMRTISGPPLASLKSDDIAEILEGWHEWGNSEFRCAAPGGDIYTEFHRLWALAKLKSGEFVFVEFHWADEDMGVWGNYAKILKASHQGELSRSFQTNRIVKSYMITNQECSIS